MASKKSKKTKKATPPPAPERREPTYWDSVVVLAEDVKESCPDPGKDHNCRVERIHENVDGNAWIIYYDNNETVLKQTHNDPDPGDVRSMSRQDADWKDMRQVAAYLAMEGDVWEALRDLDQKETT